MRHFLFTGLFVFLWLPVFGQTGYDSIRPSSTIPFKGVEWFFTSRSPKQFQLYYKNGQLLRITGKLAALSKKKAEFSYVRNNVYILEHYYNSSGPNTADSIFFYPSKFIISNSQYRGNGDIIGRYIIDGDLRVGQFECRIYTVPNNFAISDDGSVTESKLSTADLVYHFIMYKKGDCLVKKVVKSMHTFHSNRTDINEYCISKAELLFYNVPLLMIR